MLLPIILHAQFLIMKFGYCYSQLGKAAFRGIKLFPVHFLFFLADSESSREDDAEVLSRIAIKKQSKELIDRQTKKCNTRRRKKPK